MSVFVISDLHLSFGTDKPMDVFGGKWKNHADRLAENWKASVTPNDIVVIPGDISWGMNEQEVLPDLLFLQELPGTKILMKGNHEYWWQTARKLEILQRNHGLDSLVFFYNMAVPLPEYGMVLCGTRGWLCPSEKDFSPEDQKIYEREVMRLSRSLQLGEQYRKEHPECRLIVFLHYPPFHSKREDTGFTELLSEYNISHCYYGHLHGYLQKYCLEGQLPDSACQTTFHFTAADYLQFQLLPVQHF